MIIEDLVVGPAHDNLKSYTLKELKYVSNDFTVNVDEGQGTSTSKYWDEFYANNGYIKTGTHSDGLDNCTKKIEDSHWAIDSNNRIATDNGFAENGAKVYEFRIIGINQDYKDKEKTQYAGLTLMATHCQFINQFGSEYETNNQVYAKYGWEGDEEGGKCTLQSYLNDTPNYVPSKLKESITPVYKEYGISEDKVNVRSVSNKLWAPSVHELCNYKEEGMPYYEKEGNYYLCFKEKEVSMETGALCLKYIQFAQDYEKKGEEELSSTSKNDVEIHTRTLFNGEAMRSINFGGYSGMLNLGDGVYYKFDVAPCFCL